MAPVEAAADASLTSSVVLAALQVEADDLRRELSAAEQARAAAQAEVEQLRAEMAVLPSNVQVSNVQVGKERTAVLLMVFVLP